MNSQHQHFTPEQRISYLGSIPPIIQFSGLLIGVFLNYLFPTRMLSLGTAQVVGTILIVIASVIVFWSQKTSANFHKLEKKAAHGANGEGETSHRRNFAKGPYKFMSNPTSFALALLVIGFGFIVDSLMIVLISSIGYWLSYIFYEEKKSKIMAERYQDEYVDYTKKVGSLF